MSNLNISTFSKICIGLVLSCVLTLTQAQTSRKQTNSEHQTAEPSLSVSLRKQGNVIGYADVFIDWQELKADRDVDKNDLVLAIGVNSLLAPWKFYPLESGDFLGIFGETSGDSISFWKSGSTQPTTEYGGILLGCDSPAMTSSNCYRIKKLQIVFHYFNGTEDKLTSASTPNLFFLLSGEEKVYVDNLNAPDFAPIVISSIDRASAKTRWDETVQKKIETDRKLASIKTAAAKSQAIIDANNREKVKAERLAEFEKVAKEKQNILVKSPIGTTIFCNTGQFYLLMPGKDINSMPYTCDLFRNGQSIWLDELLKSGWDIASEQKSPQETDYGALGYIVSLRLKKVSAR